MAPTAHCQLYIVLETDAHGAGLERLESVLRAAGPAVACVLFRPGAGAALGRGELQTAIHRVQARDVAVLLADDAELARELGADGVHLSSAGSEDEARSRYAIARAALGNGRTVGASAGQSRHLAMVLGEIGADYVAFERGPSGAAGESAVALAEWWAPLFELPAVALGVESAAEADRLAAAGVEFVGVVLGDEPAEQQARHFGQLAEAISTGESAA